MKLQSNTKKKMVIKQSSQEKKKKTVQEARKKTIKLYILFPCYVEESKAKVEG